MIVDLFFARNEAAISMCDEKYGEKLKKLGFKIINDSEKCEEALDDTYMKSWQSIPPKEPRSYLFAFLARIMRTVCLDGLRGHLRKKRGAELTAICDELAKSCEDTAKADDEIFLQELTSIIGDFLGGAKDEYRRIFVMRYFYMETVEDIAKHLAVSVGKVKTVLFRMREGLKVRLESYGYQI